MTMQKTILVCLGALVTVAIFASSATASRLAIIVGNNGGLSQEVKLKYAETDAEKVAKALHTLSDFDEKSIHLVLGKSPNQLRDRLRGLATTIKESEDLQLFFYYSGHGDGTYLHMAGERIAVSELRTLLGKDTSGLRIIVIDSCQSGEVIRTKGAQRGPSFDINLIQDPDVEGTILITSSSQNEVSQESDTLQGSFFTHYWVSGLYGPADVDRDRLVTLEEAYRYAHFQTVERTISSRGGVQHPSFRFALTGQGNVVMASLHRSTATIQITTSGKAGRYFILDPKRRLVLTELQQTSGQARVQLPPGKYQISKREQGRFLVLDVTLNAGQSLFLVDRDMKVATYTERIIKGETVRSNRDNHSSIDHGPIVLMGWHDSTIENMKAGFDLSLGYEAQLGHLYIRPRLRVLSTEIKNGTIDVRHREFNLGGVAGLRFDATPFELSIGLDGGLIVYDSDQPTISGLSPGGFISVGLEGGIMGEWSYAVWENLSLLGFTRVGLQVFQTDDTTSQLLVPDKELETSTIFAGGIGLRLVIP